MAEQIEFVRAPSGTQDNTNDRLINQQDSYKAPMQQ